jgi:hypothetical protein
MPFLALNGITMPIARGGKEENRAVGFEMARAHTGTPLTDVRAYKRSWRFQSVPLPEQTARSLIGLVQGRGYSWNFNSTDYSVSGLVSSGAVRTLRGLAADSAAVYDENGTLYAKYGASTSGGDVAVESSTTNVFNAIATPAANSGANICTGTDTRSDTSGFTVLNSATLTSDTTQKWQGSRALKVVCTSGATQDGFRTGYGTVTANATVVATVHLYCASAATVAFDLQQNSAAPATIAGSSTSVTLPAGAWRRVKVTGTLSGGNTTVTLRVYESNAADDITFWADGFQLEESAFPTAWVATTRAAGQLIYADCLSGFYDFTINGWFCAASSNPTANQVLLQMGKGSGASNNYVQIIRRATLNEIRFVTGHEANGLSQIATYSSSPWNGNWHMVTAVGRINPESGENAMTIYFDGSSVATAAAMSGYVGFTDGDEDIMVGSGQGGGLPFNQGRIDDLQVLPYAATAAQVSAWYSLGLSAALSPKMYATGDFIPEPSATVIGEIHESTFMPHQNGAAWRANGRIVDFSLHEV